MAEFKVFEVEGEGEYTIKNVYDHEYAAMEWAHRNDGDMDYTMAEGNEVEVVVTDCDGVSKKFFVSGEPSVNYSAREG